MKRGIAADDVFGVGNFVSSILKSIAGTIKLGVEP